MARYPNAITNPGTANGNMASESSTPRNGIVERTTTYAIAIPMTALNITASTE